MLLKKFLHRLSELSDLKLLFTRYFVSAVTVLEMVLVPLALTPDFYTQVEFLRYAFMLIPMLLLGSYAGYLYVFYNQKHDLQASMLLFSLLTALPLALFAGFWLNSVLAALAIFCVVIVLPLEKVLVARRELILASIYKSLISIVMIVLCGYFYWVGNVAKAIGMYSFAVVVGTLAWIFILIYRGSIKLPAISVSQAWGWFSEYRQLIRFGFLLNMQSYALAAYFLFDRYVVNHFYTAFAAEYALAFNLSQIVFIGLNTIAFSAQQKVGEEIDTLSLQDYSRYLKTTSGLFVVLLVLGLAGVVVFSFILREYGQFYFSFIILAALVGAFYLFSSFASVAFYKGKALEMLLILCVGLLANSLLTYFMMQYEIHYYLNLIKSAVIIFVCGLLTDRLTRRALSCN